MFKQEEQKLNRNMCTASNPLVVMFTASGEGGKCVAISTFALLFSNEKWKVENGKILSPLQGGGRSCACISKLQMRGGGSSRRDILKKPTLQSWHCQYKHGSGV